MPMPICKNFSTSFDSTDGILSDDKYLGDPSDTDWIYNGYIDEYDESLLLAMPNQSSGTVLSSTRYIWYGKVSATLKTSHLQGVVTAFILFSNVQDEIDYEFVGKYLEKAETNYYYEAVLNYSNVLDANVSNTYENYHTYEVDWQEEELSWIIDGEKVRTIKKADTWNDSTDSYHYPQTPSRVQVSLWPAGSTKNSIGTIEWAGGEINWDSQDIKEYGYYYMLLRNISVQCYEPPSGIAIDGDVSYIYNNSKSWNQDDVMITDEDTVLGSDEASGLNPDEGKSSSSSDGSSSTSTDSDSSTKTKSSSGGKSTGSSNTKSGSDNNNSGGKKSSSAAAATGFVQFSTAADSGSSSSNQGLPVSNNSVVSLIVSFMMFFITF